MYKKGTGNDKQGKDAGNRTLCPYRNFSQAISSKITISFKTVWHMISVTKLNYDMEKIRLDMNVLQVHRVHMNAGNVHFFNS